MLEMHSNACQTELRLSAQQQGCVCLVVRLDHGQPDASRELRRLGVVEGETLQVARDGDRMLIDCGGSRVALHRQIAAAVEVAVLTGPDAGGMEFGGATPAVA